MIFDPEYFLALEVVVPGQGWAEADTLFIREKDGRYRIASADDISSVRERFPDFFRRNLDADHCEQCGAKQIDRLR